MRQSHEHHGLAVMLAPATVAELEAVVDLFAHSRAVCLPFLPVLHSRDEDLAFFGGYIAQGQMLLALVDKKIAGFLVQTPGWIEHLYLDPAVRRRGIGQTLLAHAKAQADQLDLWCFAENHAARAFYAAQGFAEIGGTQGDNEAGLPDILFRWQRRPLE